MTGTYEWNPIPHRVAVSCPACRWCAEFEFAEIVRIKLKVDVEFFQASDSFEYQQFQDSCGHFWHGALFFEGLHGSPSKAIHALPPGYAPEDWNHSRHLLRSWGQGVGSVKCEHCGTRGKHKLNWPDDAYFAIAYRSKVLWAFHRESAIELQHYLLSTKRDISQYSWASFLLHVPTIFKTQKARFTVAKQLQKLLAPKLDAWCSNRSLEPTSLYKPRSAVRLQR